MTSTELALLPALEKGWADEYPLMTQGVVAAGELLLTFTILYRDPASPARQQTLDMLARARHIHP